MRFTSFAGRILYSLIFIIGGLNNFSSKSIAYAASAGVPEPHILVPLSGVLALAGGLSLVFGFHARVGAVLLILFLIPVTLYMHAFWKAADPTVQQMQIVNFMKNIALLGGALAFLAFGAGPVSIDAHREEPIHRHAHAAV
jgi:putative oxidoreductase